MTFNITAWKKVMLIPKNLLTNQKPATKKTPAPLVLRCFLFVNVSCNADKV